jgi:hypothetical protein
MGFIEKRSGGYRARYRDPLGHLTSKTFTRKADAERWAREMEVDMERGDWLDPRGAQVPWPRGRRSSCPWPGACHPPRRRPTGAT